MYLFLLLAALPECDKRAVTSRLFSQPSRGDVTARDGCAWGWEITVNRACVLLSTSLTCAEFSTMGVIIPEYALANLRMYKYSGIDKLVNCF